MTTRSMSPQQLRSRMPTFATKKLSTGANGQKEDAASFFFPRSFDRAVMVCRPVTVKVRYGSKARVIVTNQQNILCQCSLVTAVRPVTRCAMARL